jgi:hypothetical protein
MYVRHDISRPVWIIVPRTASGRKNFGLDLLGRRGLLFGAKRIAVCPTHAPITHALSCIDLWDCVSLSLGRSCVTGRQRGANFGLDIARGVGAYFFCLEIFLIRRLQFLSMGAYAFSYSYRPSRRG